jgi:arginyl-tRNA--protein-N-Asp/Glu arginylyltransferase
MGQWLTRSGQIEPCVYQLGRPSRYEVMIPTERLTPKELDDLHAAGARRSGWLFYRLDCPGCQACEPLRVHVAKFQMTRSQRRVWKGNQDLEVSIGEPQAGPERVALYNKHLFERQLNTSDEAITIDQYRQWLVESGVQTVEFLFRDAGKIVGVGLVDLGEQDASSVYFFFDPVVSKRSLGTFSMLKEIEWLAQRQTRFHYLGFYNDECAPLRYKAGFGPHELLTFEKGEQRWSGLA